MRPEIKDLLLRFDEAGAYEFPSGFDYPELDRRARMVFSDIEKSGVQVGFEDAVHNQDASFSVSVVLHGFDRIEELTRYQAAVRFSNFGNLASVTFADQIPKLTMDEIKKSLLRHGFIFVCADELDCDYDGVMTDKENTFQTWWIRYFDWL